MRIVIIILIVAVLGIAGGLIFAYSGIYDVSASYPHSPFTQWVLSTVMHESVKRRADNISVPDLDRDGVRLAGANDYAAMCAGCHGAPGQPLGGVGQGLNPPAPDLAESAARMSAAELFWVTKHGIRMTGMPAWGVTHADDDLWSVVAFMTTLPDLDATSYAAMLERGADLGHHAADTAEPEHHDVHRHGEATSEPDSSAQEGARPEHDHSEHSH